MTIAVFFSLQDDCWIAHLTGQQLFGFGADAKEALGDLVRKM